jgi:hypothetical protein
MVLKGGFEAWVQHGYSTDPKPGFQSLEPSAK